MHLDHSIYIQVDNLKQIITKEVFSVPSFSRELQIREFNKLQVTSLFNNYQKDIDPWGINIAYKNGDSVHGNTINIYIKQCEINYMYKRKHYQV